MQPDSILLVLPVPFRAEAGRLLFESQAINGLDRWTDNFRRVVVACPVEPDWYSRAHPMQATYLDVDRVRDRDRLEFVPLPWAYGLTQAMRTYRPIRALLAEKIRECEFLSFAIGGLIGDWASVASLEAIRQGRPFSVWTDRVEHEVVKSGHLDQAGLKRAYRMIKNNAIVSPLMKRLHRHIIRNCALGLFHGHDCFVSYAPDCSEPHLVHDIHLKPEDQIPGPMVEAKVARVRAGGPLRITYAGRAVAMKGPMDWLRIIAAVRDAGVSFRATWLGDGSQIGEMRSEVDRLGLGGVVDLAGHLEDRQELLRRLRDSDLFVFCHKTPESPRCLIEALMSGVPLAGYDSPFPRDLLGPMADRLLGPRNDEAGLEATILRLDGDREELAGLIQSAAEAGRSYSDVAVFRHRSELIREHLKVGDRPRPVNATPGR